MRWAEFFCFLSMGMIQASSASSEVSKLKHPLDESLKGVHGPYTNRLIEVLKTWPKSRPLFDQKDPNPVQIEAFNHPDRKNAIGFSQAMIVHASLGQVKEILLDFKHYKDLFFTFEDVKLVSQDANLAVTYWENRIPIPFIPNSTYSMWYLWDDRSTNRALYRYQLKEGKSLRYSDGIIVLDSEKQFTRYSEFDFYDADWGIAETFAPGRIWGDSLEDIYYSDIVIKLKAENPSWTYKKIREEAEKSFENFPKKQVLESKHPFP